MSRVCSMTGFASLQAETEDGVVFTLTAKSVNHRFLDLALRLPSGCDEMEATLRRMVKEEVRRGHVDLTLQIVRAEGSARMLVNQELLAGHVAAYREAATKHGVGGEVDLNAILRAPGVLRAELLSVVDDTAALQTAVLTRLPALLQRLNDVRAEEGATLATELGAAMRRLDTLAVEIAASREGARASYAGRLRGRMVELLEGAAVPEERVAAEAALLAEKSDIDEELVRLRTHAARFLTLLDEGGELGKRCDFLLQELHREANTLLAKTSGASAGDGLRITELGLEMKLEIEKAREQVQNLE